MVLLNVKATACPAYPSSYVGYFRLEQAMKLKLAEINPKDPSNVPCRSLQALLELQQLVDASRPRAALCVVCFIQYTHLFLLTMMLACQQLLKLSKRFRLTKTIFKIIQNHLRTKTLFRECLSRTKTWTPGQDTCLASRSLSWLWDWISSASTR